jgi:hypothetical protein
MAKVRSTCLIESLQVYEVDDEIVLMMKSQAPSFLASHRRHLGPGLGGSA